VWPFAFCSSSLGITLTLLRDAYPGSTVTLFVNGLGLAGESPSTGVIAVGPETPLQVAVTVSGDAELVLAQSDPGSVNSVWMVKVKITPGAGGMGHAAWLARFTLTFGGAPLRDQLVVWAKAPQ
jgi:hypothetical protein